MKKNYLKLKEAFLLGIERIMYDRRLNASDLAKMLGVSRQNISKILDPDSNITFATVSKIAEVLEVEESDLVDVRYKKK